VKLHFDVDERDVLLAALSWNGTDYGLDRHARRTYGRSLSALTEREAAMVVAWTHAPIMYLRDPDRLRLRANYILQQSGVL
jgi:membrane peptidoglycan carboxypeptidase